MHLQIEHMTEGRHDVLTPIGEVDLSNYAQLRSRIADLLSAGRNHVVVDLSETEFLDSTALGALIGGRRRAYASNGSFALICNRPALRHLFAITKLDVVFETWESLEEWRSSRREQAQSAPDV